MVAISAQLTKKLASQQIAKAPANYQVDKSQFGKNSFGKILENQVNQDNQKAGMQILQSMVDNMGMEAKPMEAIPADDITIEMANQEIPTEPASSSGDVLKGLLEEVNHSQNSMSQMMESMVAGHKKMGMRDLLAAQMMMAQHTVMLELTSKAASSADQGIKSLQNMAV